MEAVIHTCQAFMHKPAHCALPCLAIVSPASYRPRASYYLSVLAILAILALSDAFNWFGFA
jgi:hypothetical protein